MNRTLLQMLRTTASDNSSNWPAFLPSLMSAYRMTVHTITGLTPNMAMLGREVLLPATLIATPPSEPSNITVPYVISFRDTLRNAHEQIRQSTHSAAKTQKNYFDKHVKGSPFAVNQLFWFRPPIRQIKKKLQRLWTGPWEILSFITPLVVRIQHTTTHKIQTVHVDHLTPCYNQSPPITSASTPPLSTPTISPPPLSSSEYQTTAPTPPATTPLRTSSRTKRTPRYLNSYVPE